MTHMHIPDGILPVWLWVSGYIITVIALTVSLRRLKGMDVKKKVPLLGALGAAMLVAMQVPILPPLYHINLSVITGILLGPALGFIEAFIVNLMLTLLGHGGGGISVLGLNTIVLGSEIILGHVFFSIPGGRLPVFWRAAAATLMTLLLSTSIVIGIVAASNLDIVGLFTHAGGHGHVYEDHASVSTFARIVVPLVVAGWLIEAAITGGVTRFISRVKPDLLSHRLHQNSNSASARGDL